MAEQDYGLRLLPQVVDEAAKEDPSRVIGMIARSSNISKGFQKFTMGELAKAVDYTAYWIDERIGRSNQFEVIAYVGACDFRYWIMELAAMKCGYTMLLPSARNSDANNQSLFHETKATMLFYSQPSFEVRAAALRPIGVEGFLIPSFDEILTTETPSYAYTKCWEDARLDPVLICHTSGSTGAPKPITYTNAFLATFDASRKLPGAYGRPDGNMSNLDGIVHFLGFPSFHLMGVGYGLCTLFYETTQVLPPTDMPPDGKMITDIMGQIDLGALICPPSLMDDIVKNYRQEFIERSHSLIAIHNGGGPLARSTGDFLASRVNIMHIIGSTEAGRIACLISEREEWGCYEWNPHASGVRMERLEGDEDIYELTVERVPGQERTQGIFITFPHLDVWRTRDLFRKHPTKNLWIFEGRKDDVIVLNNGEKFNPVAMEMFISGHPLIKGAMVVGNSYDQTGIILETDEPESDFVEKVWSTIQKANEEAPRHARIYKEKVITASPGKPFRRAGKGTIQRPATTRDYKEEIAQMYNNKYKKNSYRPSAGLPALKLPKSVLMDFVRQGVTYQLDRDDFTDSDDLYFLGFDSLQTTQLAKTLVDSLGPHMPPGASRAVSPRFVYDNPSIDKIANALFLLLNPELSANDHLLYDVDQMAFEKIQNLIQKYTDHMTSKAKVDASMHKAPGELHIAVTGTTGFLGYYLLSVLSDDPAVRRITCLNRSPTAKEKFIEQCSLYRPKSPVDLSKLEFLKISFGEKSFGLSQDKFKELVTSVDAVVHNAWQVDFNRNLSSFENPHLIGVRTLIDWSLQSPRDMHIFYVSSISTAAVWPGFNPTPNCATKEANGTKIEEHPATNVSSHRPNGVSNGVSRVPETPPTFARIPAKQLGYAQSKYTAESILAEASSTRNIRTTIIRPGQISNARSTPGPLGGRTEWFPLLLLSSKSLGLIPQTAARASMIDFIAVDQLAVTIRDIVHDSLLSPNNSSASSKTTDVFNLVNPHTVPFSDLIPAITRYFADECGMEDAAKVVPFTEWMAALKQKSSGDADAEEKYPALKLLGFFEGMGSDWDSRDTEVVIETRNGCRVSETMKGMEAVGMEDVSAWLRDWKI